MFIYERIGRQRLISHRCHVFVTALTRLYTIVCTMETNYSLTKTFLAISRTVHACSGGPDPPPQRGSFLRRQRGQLLQDMHVEQKGRFV